jgi:DNA-binding CsgD family transcriptional regulator/tetratricopeptide (TPR) repeat protein
MSMDPGQLIERDEYLSVLGDILRRAMDGSGRVVVVSGEAGIGKTSLLRKFVHVQPKSRSTYWGSCDALFTPIPLGPMQEIASRLDAELARQLESGAKPGKIFARLLAVLEAHKQLPILVIEDVHWADTSTLDLIRFLGRRITSLRALLLLSLRSDEVTRDHPIWRAIGEISPTSIRRLEIAPLTRDGVRQLVKGSSLDVEHLHRLTGGNPFFASELISSQKDGSSLPASIKEALRSRRARIGKSANAMLDVISIFPSSPPEWLLTPMLRKASPRCAEECIAVGLLVRGENGELRFRHDLARLAVLEDIPTRSRQSLHARAVDALKGALAAGHPVQSSTIIHHASGANDGREVLRLAPLAASDAARMGAHAQAAAHLSTALGHVALATPEQAAELYESWSYEASLAVKIDEKTIEARLQAIKLWRNIGRQEKVGLNLRWLARLHWYRGEAEKADEYLSEALAVLEALPPGPELATAYAVRSQMLMLHRRTKEAVEWGNRAITLARECAEMETLVHALNTVGTAKLYADDDAGISLLEESLERSLEHGLHEQAARAYNNIASCALSRRDFAVAEAYAIRGIKFNSEHDLDTWIHTLFGYQAQLRLDQGRLTEARDIAEGVLRREHLTRVMRMPAMNVLTLARARLGDDTDYERLDAALGDATSIGELQYLLPARLALIEASWLKGDMTVFNKHIVALSELPLERLNTWNFGDAIVWFHRCDRPTVLHTAERLIPPPRQLEIAGRQTEAADALFDLGMRYEAAMVLAHARGNVAAAALSKALQTFEELGARPGVEFVRRRGACLGISHQLPRPKRGPYAKSRSHPLGLTGREIQILKYVKDGLSNREISVEVSRSERTIEHHISAVLAKLSVRNRIEALIRVQTEPWLLGTDDG